MIADAGLAPEQPGPKEKRWRPGKWTPKAITQIYEMQRIVLERVRNPNLKGVSLAALVRAWDVLEERKRILRGVPLPGMLRPTLDPAKLAKQLRQGKLSKSIETTSFVEQVQEPTKGIS